MKTNRVLFIIVTFILLYLLITITNNFVLSTIIIMLTVVPVTVFILLSRFQKLNNLLDENCDPESFLEKAKDLHTKKLITGPFFQLLESIALSSQGHLQQSLDLLLDLGEASPVFKGANKLGYYHNLSVFYYALEKIDEGEICYNKFSSIPLSKKNRFYKFTTSINIQRAFYLGDYKQFKAMYDDLNWKKISKRMGLQFDYLMAQVYEQEGQIDLAKKLYLEVYEQGNKLYVAEQSKNKLAQL